MKRILASRLYKSLPSSRQNHIKAAISNPINAELVSQLKEYLDDDYQEIVDNEVRRQKQEKDAKSDESAELDNEEGTESGDSSGSASRLLHKPSGGRLADKFNSLFEEDEDSSGGAESSDVDSFDTNIDVDDSVDELDDNVEESTDIEGVEDLTHSEGINADDMSSQIVENLNSDPSTSGIVRSACKGDEIWIYYSDSINLNTVMSSVIESVVTMFPSLEFNRLARTDNAIVFQHIS